MTSSNLRVDTQRTDGKSGQLGATGKTKRLGTKVRNKRHIFCGYVAYIHDVLRTNPGSGKNNEQNKFTVGFVLQSILACALQCHLTKAKLNKAKGALSLISTQESMDGVERMKVFYGQPQAFLLTHRTRYRSMK